MISDQEKIAIILRVITAVRLKLDERLKTINRILDGNLHYYGILPGTKTYVVIKNASSEQEALRKCKEAELEVEHLIYEDRWDFNLDFEQKRVLTAERQTWH